MQVITKNKTNTVGIATEIQNLKNLGTFRSADISEWLEKVRTVFGDDDINIRFKLSDDPARPGYLVAASSTEQPEPMVVVTGQYRLDGKVWET